MDLMWKHRRSVARRLRRLDLFSECGTGELARVDRLLTEVRVLPGRTIARQGQPGSDFVIVAEGNADVTRDGRFLARLSRGDFFGELTLLGDRSTLRSATVTALTPMTVYVLNPREFALLLEVAPSVRERVLDAARTREAFLQAA